ncbi:hypothetical protein PHPALM_17655 [Phytophthora palmivora]|uniref:DDE Tnp4 domain-containing protein n=1 Tax=Phytophthora palmivora TaxID=4796 RepID=A0A2P4XLR2_9STRA|nr:hypothetical protein PHPALM_17655 [Phytophthora palmivora]
MKEHSFEEKVACFLFFSFLKALRRSLRKFIHFPRHAHEWTRVQGEFQAKGRIPGVVGTIDGSLKEITRPEDFVGYYCRKMFPALYVQAVVDDTICFTSVKIRPGSWSDQNKWRAFTLGSNVKGFLPAGTHFLGDAGYAISPAIMTPFMENDGAGLTRKQLLYNYLDSRTRVAVECAFGFWKGRFRIVNCCIKTKCAEKAVGIVAATIVLHNNLLGLKDDTSLEDGDDVQVGCKEEEEFVVTGNNSEMTASFLRDVGSRKREFISAFTEAFGLV